MFAIMFVMQCSSEVRSMNDVELHNAVVGSQKEADRLAARQAELVAEWTTRRIWSSDGSKSPAARLARETGLSNDDASHLVHRAKRLSSMPPVPARYVLSGICPG